MKLFAPQKSALVASVILRLYDWYKSISAALHMIYLIDLIM